MSCANHSAGRACALYANLLYTRHPSHTKTQQAFLEVHPENKGLWIACLLFKPQAALILTSEFPVLVMDRLALLLLATLLASSHATDVGTPMIMHLLRPQSGSDGSLDGVSCMSWRLAVETNNIQSWSTVPSSCEDYVGHYMLGDRYRKDSKVVARVAELYAKSLKLARDGMDLWVFDIDETVLSNLPYYAKHGFGAEMYNSSSANAWVNLGKLPALPESLNLYKKLLSLGFKVAFLTGRPESQREITTTNLRSAGYMSWEKLILRGEADLGKTAVVYKSAQRKKLEKAGYRIHGNMGDQWSDILGTNIGTRTFKVPDPMYYIS